MSFDIALDELKKSNIADDVKDFLIDKTHEFFGIEKPAVEPEPEAESEPEAAPAESEAPAEPEAEAPAEAA